MAQDVLVEPHKAEVERVFRTEAPKMWRAMLAFGGDPDVASDAVAEAFAQAIARGAEVRSASAWIWRTCYLVARRELRARPTSGTVRDVAVDLPEPVRDIVVAMRELSPNQRIAVLMHDYADRTTAEVAAALGIAAPTVRVHLVNGRRRLRRHLEES